MVLPARVHLKADKKAARLVRMVGFRIQVRMIWESVEITALASEEEKSLRRSDREEESEPSVGAEGARRRGGKVPRGGGRCEG